MSMGKAGLWYLQPVKGQISLHLVTAFLVHTGHTRILGYSNGRWRLLWEWVYTDWSESSLDTHTKDPFSHGALPWLFFCYRKQNVARSSLFISKSSFLKNNVAICDTILCPVTLSRPKFFFLKKSLGSNYLYILLQTRKTNEDDLWGHFLYLGTESCWVHFTILSTRCFRQVPTTYTEKEKQKL